LFWKKIKQNTNKPTLQEDQREAFRYMFKGEDHLLIEFKQKKVKLLDISAGGVAFRNQDFSIYDADIVNFVLDIPNFRGDTKFTATLRIITITDRGICHCIFENCTIEEYEKIHKYVLEMQKNDLIKYSKNQTR
jgi:hypothetical protein